MGKVYCAACQKRCKGDVLKIEQHFVHPKCFRCAKCSKSLQQGGFFVRDKRLYCPEDYQTEFGVKCAQCNKFVEGEVVKVLNKTFHLDCFRCFGCGRPFTSGERTTIVNEAYYCSVCSSLVASNPGAAATTPTKALTLPDVSAFPDGGGGGGGGRERHTLDHGAPVTENGSAGDQLTDRERLTRLRGVAPTGQLTVHINENGYTHSDPSSTKVKSTTLNHHHHHHFDQGVDRSTLDTLLSTTPGQTYSGVGFSSDTPSTTNFSQVRTCPPGVDYGRHYPLSYLRLAEHGLTAIMTGDELRSPPARQLHHLRSRSLAHQPTASPRHLGTESTDGHQSRSATRSVPLTKPTAALSGHVCNGSFLSSSPPGHHHQVFEDHHQHQLTTPGSELPSGTVPSQGSSSIWHSTGQHTPVPTTGADVRPKRDLYVRQRQLSPGAASLSCGLVGYHSRSPRFIGSRMQPGSTDRSTHRSTPNVCAKRGMTLLAESLMQPRPRPDRSQSPDSSATEYWVEARRLASYPSARLPDSNSLPAIERLDFPAPPSPAVVMLERRREKRLTLQRERERQMAAKSQNGTGEAGVDLLDSSLSDGEILSADLSEKVHRINAEIEKLRRLGDSSGMTAALIQELESSKQAYLREPDLDPVSASRSPSANREPGYKTRYEQHGFASPSRDNRRLYRSMNRHTLSYAMDYSRTGGRSGTVPNNSLMCSTSTPRPGYTSGILYGRAVSLPRSVASPLPNGGLGVSVRGAQPAVGPQMSRSQGSTLPPAGSQSGHTGGQVDTFGGLVDLDDSVRTTDVLRSGPHSTNPPFEQSGIASLATSALSVDGMTVTEEVSGTPGRGLTTGRSTTLDMSSRGINPNSSSYCLKAGTLAGGLPPSVTGLRPIRYRRSNTMGPTVYQQGPELREDGDGGEDTATLLFISESNTCPSVQDWLRPTSGKGSGQRDTASFKIHPYEQLRLSSGQPPMKGVDRTKLELHLSAEEFEALFQMPVSAFRRLPEWKRNDLKKKVDLL